jgi:hypothetical protein
MMEDSYRIIAFLRPEKKNISLVTTYKALFIEYLNSTGNVQIASRLVG